MRRLLLFVLVIGAGYYAFNQQQRQNEQLQQQASAEVAKTATAQNTPTTDKPARDRRATVAGDDAIKRAFDEQLSDVRVQASGVVEKVLRDDTEGSKHQRFIVRLASGQKILIAHNIDLASRVSPLTEGDHVEFSGEYEWNNKGGVVHWTHRDPAGRHQSGWIKREGHTFQ